MANIRVLWVAVLVALLLSACGTVGKSDDIGGLSKGSTPAEQKLYNGVASYEEGDYKSSSLLIQSALELGISSKHDQVLAHKYLAFINCISGRDRQCHDEFRKALALDPAFDLKPAESGHPLWGPIFRAEKAKLAK